MDPGGIVRGSDVVGQQTTQHPRPIKPAPANLRPVMAERHGDGRRAARHPSAPLPPNGESLCSPALLPGRNTQGRPRSAVPPRPEILMSSAWHGHTL